MLAVPLWPSLVAVIVTGPPAATPVTSPLPFTLAIALLLDDQLIARPVNGFPLASLGVAVSWTVPVTATFAELGDTVTEATGARETLTVAVPLWPSLVAVIVTGPPGPAPVTSPLEVTLAIVLSLDDHTIVRPVKRFPLASFGVAVSCTVWPTVRLAVAGVTVIVATGAAHATVMFAPAVRLPGVLVAVRVCWPQLALW